MKIRTNIDNVGGRYHVLIETAAFSALEEEKMSDFGEPIVNVGGTISGSVTRPGETAPVITLSNGTGYSITAGVVDGAITGYDVVEGGSGYTSVPTVAITGGAGSNATAVALLGAATVSLSNVGSGYVIGDTITLAGGTSTAPTVLTVTNVEGPGMVTGIEITTAGSYSVIPTNPVGQNTTTGNGLGAGFTIGWTVVQVNPVVEGSDYNEVPSNISFSLNDKQRRIKTDFPDKRVFDLADTPSADLMAKVYADTIVARLTSAISTLRSQVSPFEGESLTTV